MENQNQLETGIREYITEYLRTEADEAVVKRWLDKLTDPDDPLTILAEWNTFAECHGVEYIPFPGEQFNETKGMSYANTGETYALTLLWHHRDRQFRFGDWGSAYEEMESSAIADDWVNNTRSEFRSVLENRFMTDINENMGEGDDPLRPVFDAACREAEKYPEIDGNYIICDVVAIAAQVPIEDIVEMCSGLDTWNWNVGDDEPATLYQHRPGLEAWNAIAAQKIDDNTAIVYYRSSDDDAVVPLFFCWDTEEQSFWFVTIQDAMPCQPLLAPFISPQWEEFRDREEWPWVGYYVIQTKFAGDEESC